MLASVVGCPDQEAGSRHAANGANCITSVPPSPQGIARLREAIGGAVWPARMASSAAVFQSVTTSAWARVPMKSAVETEHERSLKVFISERLRNKSLLAVAALGWRHRDALPVRRDAIALVQVSSNVV